MTPTAYKNLVKKFNSGNRGIHCGHININGFLNKIDEIRLLLSETKIDILAITDTHLHDNITDTDVDIDDYSIIRKDRLDQKNHWGGVLLFPQPSGDPSDNYTKCQNRRSLAGVNCEISKTTCGLYLPSTK